MSTHQATATFSKNNRYIKVSISLVLLILVGYLVYRFFIYPTKTPFNELKEFANDSQVEPMSEQEYREWKSQFADTASDNPVTPESFRSIKEFANTQQQSQ